MSNSALTPGEVLRSQPTHTATKSRRWLIPSIIFGILALGAVVFFLINNNSVNYRTTPLNLDLQADMDGEIYYFSQSEWNSLSYSEQNRFTKKGLVIDYNGQQFIVKLTMERHGSGYEYKDEIFFTWDEAKSWVSNMGNGWRLPTKEEGKAMADQYEQVFYAIKAFGGDKDPVMWMYWTSTEYDASSAWIFDLCSGLITDHGKIYNHCVRAVSAI